jgi:hypothetical protein
LDLRQEFDRIIEQYGHHMLMQRTSRAIRCICWDEKNQESSVNRYIQQTKYIGPLNACPRCLGKGWISRIERHKIRRDNASQIIALPLLKKQMPLGQIASDARVFYMRWDSKPKRGDIIYEVGWNGKKPTHLIQAFEIQSPDDLRAEGGRTEFFQVTCKEINIDAGIRGIAMRQIGPVENYELLRS